MGTVNFFLFSEGISSVLFKNFLKTSLLTLDGEESRDDEQAL